jgi:steroid 5-alpha reductase family enzyme
MIPLILAVLVGMLLIMTIGWVFQRAMGNGGWGDVFWTYGAGATCALAALVPLEDMAAPNLRQILVAALVALWSLRLGTYVAVRVAKGAEDARYSDLRGEWGKTFQRNMLGLLVVQAPFTALLSISVLLAARNPTPTLQLQDLVGLLILVGSILGEGVADEQMKAFKANPDNRGKVCDTGLWAWSRHPNYFFEFAGWLAYPVIAFHLDEPWSLVSIIAPALMFVLLRFGTGVPPLEKAMLASKGEAYRRYQARVSPLLLLPPKTTEKGQSA